MSVERSSALRVVSWLAFLVLWVGGVASYLWLGGPPADAAWTAPVFLALAALLVLLAAPARARAALLACGLLGYLAEVAGVATGWPFGAYAYTDALAPAVAGVPLALAAAWIVVVAFAREVVAPLSSARARVPAAAALLVLIDLLLDPVAAGPLGYWRWAETGPYHGIPLSNFAGWWLVGALLSLLLERFARERSPGVLPVGLAVMLFFTLLAASFGLVVPALAGVAVTGLAMVARAGANMRLSRR